MRSHGACKCKVCTDFSDTEVGHAVDNPFRSPVTAAARPCCKDALLQQSPCPAVGWSPRRIAEEVAAWQQYLLEAHEQQVRHLHQLLSAAGVQVALLEEDQQEEAQKVSGCEHLAASAEGGGQCCRLKFSGLQSGEQEAWCMPQMTSEKEAEQTLKVSFDTSNRSAQGVPKTENDDAASEQSICELVVESEQVSAVPSATTPPAREEPTGSKSVWTMGVFGTATSCASKASWWHDAAKEVDKLGTADQSLGHMINMIEKDDRKRPGSRCWRHCTLSALADDMYCLTEHVYFDALSGSVIALNAFFMAYETDYALKEHEDAVLPQWARLVGSSFSIFFLVELLLRMCGGLGRFFCSGNGWNYFDLVIVALTMADELIAAAGKLSNTRMVRLLRLTRALKVLRTARLVKLIGALQMLVNSLVGTLKQVMWAFFLIFCLVFVFAVIFGQAVSSIRVGDSWEAEYNDQMFLYWGSMLRCMYTLYMSVSGGISWIEAAVPLAEVGSMALLGFLFYIAAIQWVVLNVITGTFCESAAEAARKDVSLAVQKYRDDRLQLMQRCKAIFQSIDDDGSGELALWEMKPYLDSEPARALFAALDIDITDVRCLFELIDEDGDHRVNIQEFMWGCMQLKGGAKALQIAKIQLEVKQLTKMVGALVDNQGLNLPCRRASVNRPFQ
eukprot:TRINITY_DN22931_c0_g1_i1.p1 TRINITY_DN22931_c0_g1~~TRINITY_DN22931_c0_g1_i1.p1  ORF type:complete len:672 (-),score=137.01 TRINITY_DN22931_c0_g1_i1:113-2128(-)